MIKLTPTQRLEVLGRDFGADDSKVTGILTAYDSFLEHTDAAERELIAKFLDKNTASELVRKAIDFGDNVAQLLTSIGGSNRFYRLLLV